MSAHAGYPHPSLSAGLDDLLDALAERIAERIASRLAEPRRDPDRWLTTRDASAHLGLHPDTLRRLAAARAIPSEQDGPGCALHFRLSDLDLWRESGGPRRPRGFHGASTERGSPTSTGDSLPPLAS